MMMTLYANAFCLILVPGLWALRPLPIPYIIVHIFRKVSPEKVLFLFTGIVLT